MKGVKMDLKKVAFYQDAIQRLDLADETREVGLMAIEQITDEMGAKCFVYRLMAIAERHAGKPEPTLSNGPGRGRTGAESIPPTPEPTPEPEPEPMPEPTA